MKTTESGEMYKTELVDSIYGKISIFKNDQGLSKSLKLYGEWAQNEINFINNFIKPGDIVVDGGAYIGTHSLAFSKMVGPNGRVYAFEPIKNHLSILTRNVENQSNIIALNYALGPHDEVVLLKMIESGSGVPKFGSTSIDLNMTCEQDSISSIALDSLNLKRCDFIKLDIEGAELKAIYGAINTIIKFHPVIYVECNDASRTWPIIVKMNSLNYLAYGFIFDAYNQNNFNKNNENIFDVGKEIGILFINKNKKIQDNLIPIINIDDLIYFLIKKPQYKYEIMENTSGAKILGNGHWKNEYDLTKN